MLDPMALQGFCKKFKKLPLITAIDDLTNVEQTAESISENLENLRKLVLCEVDMKENQTIFLQKLAGMIEGPFYNLEVAKILLPKLAQWDVIDDNFMQTLDRVFKTESNEQVLEVILDSSIEIYVKEKSGYDLIAYLFDNPNVDVVKLLAERIFKPNARDRKGEFAIIKSARRQSVKDVKFLYDRGMSHVEMRFECTKNDMNFVWDVDCSELMIQRARVSKVSLDTLIFELPLQGFYGTTDKQLWILNTWAHMIVLEAQGLPLTHGDFLYYNPDYYRQYDMQMRLCREQVKWMEAQKITESITLFTILTATGNPKKIMRCVRDEGIISSILRSCEEKALLEVYQEKIKKNIERAREIRKLEAAVAELISENIKLFDPTNIVIRIIVGYLTYQDLLVLSGSHRYCSYRRVSYSYRYCFYQEFIKTIVKC